MMRAVKGTKNKLFKGLTEHDVLTFEEEKMRFQRRMGVEEPRETSAHLDREGARFP